MCAAHATLSPSAAEMWMTCPGSVREIARLRGTGEVREDRSSTYAAEGTAAHDVRGSCLSMGFEPYDFIGRSIIADGQSFPVTEEMAGHLQPGIDWVREKPGKMFVEQRVTLDTWLPGQFGTLDCGIVAPKVIDINDLKYGAGVPVDVERNKQLMIYGLGFWHQHYQTSDARPERFVFSIDQPRAGGLKIWECSFDELYEFGTEVRAAGLATQDPDAPLVASEKGCRWCPVRDSDRGCRAYTAWMLEMFGLAFDDDLDEEPEMVDPNTIDPARRYYIVRHATLLTQWLAKLHEDSLEAALAGRPDPGSKAVEGRRADRRFSDPQAAEAILVAALGDDAFTRKLLTPTQAEAGLQPRRKHPGNPEAWDALGPLIIRPGGKPILVPLDDRRAAIPNYRDLFDDTP